jgi:hypothetical protein
MKHALLLALVALGSLVSVSALGIWQGTIIFANEGCWLGTGPDNRGGCFDPVIQWDNAVRFGMVFGAAAALAVIGAWALTSLVIRVSRERLKSRSGAALQQSD